jgi:SecY
MPVHARRVAIVVGLMVGIYLAVVVAIRGVPDWIVALFGGPDGGVARYGGLVLRYRPPEGYDATKLRDSIERRGAAVRRDGSVLVVEVPGVAEPEANRMAALMTQGGLEFREVIEDMSLEKVPQDRRGGDDYVAPGVRLELDMWRPDLDSDGPGPERRGQSHIVPYLSADRRDQLERAFEQLRAGGWVQPPRSVIAFEHLEWDSPNRHDEWRSYLLGEVLLDGDAVANAERSSDPSTGRPIVLLDFTRPGGERFGEVTARIVGRKLATLLGGRVQSAPVIHGPIRGGRASIAMSGGDAVHQEREADALVAVLTAVALPPGGVVEGQRWIAPASIATLLGLATLVVGLAGGALLGLIVWLVVRVTRPVWQPSPRRLAGKFPARRVAVTLLAPVSLLVLGNLGVPGVNSVQLDRIMSSTGGHHESLSIVAFGVRPILSAFILVELFTLTTARRRRARYQPAARIALGRHVAILGAVIAVIQGYFFLGFLEDLHRGSIDFFSPGLLVHLAVIGSLTVGTMLLAIVAGMIRQHGLGNGYAALIISGWAITVVPGIVETPTAGHALGLLTLVMIGIVTVALLRMRVGGDREPPLRVPASGSAPLATVRGVLAQLSLLTQFVVVAGSSGAFVRWLDSLQHQPWLFAGTVVVLVPVWSFAFSRPGVVAPLAAQAALAPPSQATWRRATLLSLFFLLAIGLAALVSAATLPDAQAVCEATTAMLLAALVLDLLDDVRARRADLIAVWPLQHPQHAELVRRVLTDAGIDCHLQSSHVRTLLGFFGPYVPIDVLVPAAAAEEAHNKLGGLFQAMPLGQVFG